MKASMRGILAGSLLYLLSSLLMIGDNVFAQAREDYIITHEPSVNVRPCPRFTEECNAIYRLPAGTIILNAVVVRGDQYNSSDQWIRFWRDGAIVFVHSSLVSILASSLESSPVSLTQTNSDLAEVERAHAWVTLYNDYYHSGTAGSARASMQISWSVSAENIHVYVDDVHCFNSIRAFENKLTLLTCSNINEVWSLGDIELIQLIIIGENIDDPEEVLRCGRHNDSTYWQLLFACVLEEFQPAPTPTVGPTHTPTPTRQATSTTRPTRTPQPTSIVRCDHLTFPINGSMESRRNIFERWLECQHSLRVIEFRRLSDEERMFDIWSEFVEFACGFTADPNYWVVDPEWRCKQLSRNRDDLIAPPCGTVQLIGNEINRNRIFDRWLECEFGIRYDQYRRLHITMAEPIGWAFVTAACGEETPTYYWQINENGSCERRSVRTGEILPTFTPTMAPTQTPTATLTPSPTRTPYLTPTLTCGPEELMGSVINRVAIFERWLTCKHNIEFEVFWDLSESRWSDIWWDFVEASCGRNSGEFYWNIDLDSWECERIKWGEVSNCDPIELSGSLINRLLIFEQWLTCEYDMDFTTFNNIINESRQSQILDEFALLACGSDADDNSWFLDENWECQIYDQDDGYSA